MRVGINIIFVLPGPCSFIPAVERAIEEEYREARPGAVGRHITSSEAGYRPEFRATVPSNRSAVGYSAADI